MNKTDLEKHRKTGAVPFLLHQESTARSNAGFFTGER